MHVQINIKRFSTLGLCPGGRASQDGPSIIGITGALTAYHNNSIAMASTSTHSFWRAKVVWASEVLEANGYNSCDLVMYETSFQEFPADQAFCDIIDR